MNCCYTSLEQEALLHLQGPDALNFLQGQVTCDTRELAPDKALPGLYCTVQGRVICDFLLASVAPDQLLMRTRADIRAASAAVFSKYIVFSRAQLDAQRDDWQVSACWGPQAAALIKEVFGAQPTQQYGSCSGDGFVVVQVDARAEQFECYLGDGARARAAALREGASVGAESEWQALQIAAGIARIEAGSSGEHIPQMLNYDLTGHISFSKGCYTGQEVVARMHYRGKPKRRLYLATLASGNDSGEINTVPGTPIYSTSGTQAVGNIINSVQGSAGEVSLLLTATATGLCDGLHLADSEGPLLKTSAVPYPVPEK